MRVFALYSLKGGVGKTAAAVNLAHLSAASGRRTLLWDLDPQGAASFQLRIKPRVRGGGERLLADGEAVGRAIRGSDFERLDLLPADFSYRFLDLTLERKKRPERAIRKVLASVEDEFDQVFIDCAPSISLTAESVFAAADTLVIPTIPTVLSLRTLARLLEHLKPLRSKETRVLPFFSMVDRRKKLHRRITAYAREEQLGFLDAEIPYASVVEQMGTRRAPTTAYAPGSPASKAFEQLWRELESRADPGVSRPKAFRKLAGRALARPDQQE